MNRQWGDWNWEGPGGPPGPQTPETPEGREPGPAPHPPSRPWGGPPGGESHDRGAQIRRRRATGVLVMIGLVILIVAAAGGSGSVHHPRRASSVPPAAPTVQQQRALNQSQEDQAIKRVLAYTPLVVEGGRQRREVALTFDDGPSPYTPALLAQLQRLNLPATFFAIGNQERYFSTGTVAELSAGYPIGNHTETHPFLASLSKRDQRHELEAQIQQLGALGVPRPLLFRPPYGSYNQATLKELRHFHMLMVLWSADTEDFKRPGVAAIVRRAVGGAHPGAIILMHDGGGDRSQTIAALPAIARKLRRRGLEPVTVGQLLRDDPPAPGQAVPSGLNGG